MAVRLRNAAPSFDRLAAALERDDQQTALDLLTECALVLDPIGTDVLAFGAALRTLHARGRAELLAERRR